MDRQGDYYRALPTSSGGALMSCMQVGGRRFKFHETEFKPTEKGQDVHSS